MENKKRLIFADDIKEKRTVLWDPALGYSDCVLIEDIDEAPSVDAVEVVHGRWANPYINRYGHPCHCCSVCGFKASYQDRNYCPNCGAKMDGERNDHGSV